MSEEEQDVVLLEAVGPMKTMPVAYNDYAALFVPDSVEASLHLGATLTGLVLLFAHIVLAGQGGSTVLLLVIAAVVVRYYQAVLH